MKNLPDDDDDIESVLAIAERLVTLPTIVEMLHRAGAGRSTSSITIDVAAGRIRMGKISERFFCDDRAEARRYVQAQVEAKRARRPRKPLTQTAARFADRVEGRGAAI